MIRVVALGLRAGEIVDRLRANKKYNNIRFVYCNENKDLVTFCGRDEDEHIHLQNMEQCRKAIHDDNELMAVLVTCLGKDFDDSRKYAIEIMGELWDYADHTYCFATLPFAAGGHRPKAMEIFNWLTYWSDITVLQDDLKEPFNLCPLDMDEGLIQFLDIILRPFKATGSEEDSLPFGVVANPDQVLNAFNSLYSNIMPLYHKAGTFSFHKTTHK